MEQTVGSPSKKRRTRTKVDRIGGLPDSLLLHILSFLPAKEAVATSLISRRWRPLWLSLPSLDLNLEGFQSLPFFHRFVDKMLKLVDLKSVKKFVLEIHSSNFKPRDCFRPLKISKWINAMISNKVEHLELQLILFYGEFELPPSVFITNNIRVLKLSGVTVGTLSHVHLPLLEVLHLRSVRFPEFQSLKMLLSASASLKELVLKFWFSVHDYNPLNIGRLDHLVSADVPQSLFPSAAFSNVTFLRLDQHYCTQGIWPLSDDIPMFYNCTHLECVAGEWTRMVNCLRNFPILEKLVISESFKPASSTSPPEPVHDVPPCVSLHLKEFTLHYLQDPGSHFELLKFITENARFLRSATIRRAGASEDGLRMLQKLAANLRRYESCKPMKQPPLVFMSS